MRGISGLERPAMQWLFAGAGAALIAVSVATGVALVRARRATELARADAMQARIERQQFEASLAHERSTRESLTMALGRARETASAAASAPTLTLEPDRTPSPAGPRVAVPQTPAPVVELRLLLPAGKAKPSSASAAAPTYAITLRSWTTGDVILVRRGLHASTVDGKPAVSAFIASDVFVPGPYEVVLATTAVPQADIAKYDVSILPRTDS